MFCKYVKHMQWASYGMYTRCRMYEEQTHEPSEVLGFQQRGEEQGEARRGEGGRRLKRISHKFRDLFLLRRRRREEEETRPGHDGKDRSEVKVLCCAVLRKENSMEISMYMNWRKGKK